MGDQRLPVEQRVRERALRDPGFRGRLAADPAAALAEALDIDLADGVKIRVVEEAPGEVVLVMPARLGEASELTERGLQEAAGSGARATARSGSADVTCS